MNRGSLYIVSTPIGNLEDITLRAIRILREVDVIAAEDTRITGFLLKHLNIQTHMESYHDHNKTKKTPLLINWLLRGKSIAIVSDAGTPGISDPAYTLVREAVRSSIKIIPIPGPTAVITGLSISGLPTDRFVFEGFLPPKKGRKNRLAKLAEEPRTIILYEAPHRLLRTFSDLLDTLGNRTIAVCRELTKKFEEILRGPLTDMINCFENKKIQGEFVLIIQGYTKKNV
ncbi:16S rRNA (cytidine(1402)-2'-O)-methyltransferase [bacterium]|nr:16S rRNA (cytidine(1402)-2'-O)-methyltransferase [bacterium]RQV93328.1 MAG: 16S rRNA (cytidine(1402)-2'-O)-methyltransferase [bacterium]